MNTPRCFYPLRLTAIAVALLLPAQVSAAWRILDAEGDPVAGAEVEIHLQASSSDLLARLATPSRKGTSDLHGRVSLPAPALPVLVIVDHPRFAPWSAELGPTERPEAVYLAPGRSLSGIASSQKGPVSRGSVCATWEQEKQDWGVARAWERCAQLEDEGTFTLVGLPDRTVDFLLRAQGFLPHRRAIYPPSAVQPLKLELEAGILLRGAVAAADQTEIHRAEVQALHTDSVAVPGPRGSFDIPVPSLPVVLEARAPGFHPQRIRVQKAPTPERPLRFQLHRAERLIGMILGEDGLPPEEAELVWEHEAHGGRRTEAHPASPDDGSFEIDLPAPGVYGVVARASDYRDELLPEVTVGSGETVDLATILLTRGAGVIGAAFDSETGDPVSGVGIRLLPLGTDLFRVVQHDQVPFAVTEGDGGFEIFGLDPGRYELRAQRVGYSVHTLEVTVQRDAAMELDPIYLSRGATLRGRLVDRSGAPRSGLRVRIFDAETSALIPIDERTSDGLGAFEGPDLAPGHYRVTVVGERLLLAQELHVPEGVEDLEIELVVEGVDLWGVARRGRNRLSGGTVILTAALDPGTVLGKLILHGRGSQGGSAAFGLPETTLAALVAEDGSFRLQDAPPGLLWATYVGTGGWSATREVLVPDQSRVEVVLDFSGVKLSGRVMNPHGAAVPGAHLRVLEPTGRTLGESRSDLDGRFAVANLAPGRYHLEARADGHASRTLQAIDVGQGAPPLEIVLEPGDSGRLEASLTRKDGSPLAGNLLSLLEPGGRVVRSLLSDARGFRPFDGLPEGDYFLVWSDPIAGVGHSPPIRVEGGETVRWEGVVAPGGPLRLDCRLESCAGSTVDLLTVHSASGVPLGSFLSGMSAGLRFSRDGTLTLGRLSPGRYLLTLWTGGHRIEVPVEMTSGQGSLVAFP